MTEKHTKQQIQRAAGVVYVLTLCCAAVGGLSPPAAQADGSRATDSAMAEGTPALRFQNGPCGIRSLRGQGEQGGGADLLGVWHCAQQILLPARFRAADTDSDSPSLSKKNGLKWGVRVRHDRVLVSVGFKW